MPIVVVSDSSPVRSLDHLGRLSLLRDLYGTVIIPEAVRAELRQATTTCPALEVADYSWFELRRPISAAYELGVPAELDAGESEAIALAIDSLFPPRYVSGLESWLESSG